MNYNAIMRIPRFYCPDISSDVLEIHDQKIIHHLIKVLRARQGQRVVLFDGSGKTFECEIKEIEKNKIKLDLLDKCGKHPQELKNLFQITELAIKAKNLDIKKITQTSKFIKIGFLENVSDNILETIIKLTSHSSGSYQIKKNGELWINYADEDVLNLLNEVINEF